MKLTIEPTDQMMQIDGIELRAWTGIADNNSNVVALIAAVQFKGAALPSGLTPIPAPAAGRSSIYRVLLEELWHDVQRLSDEELSDVVGMARARASFRDPHCEERHCERCGSPYRGPGVYCRLQCALDDA